MKKTVFIKMNLEKNSGWVWKKPFDKQLEITELPIQEETLALG
jgi:hypothetical protein